MKATLDIGTGRPGASIKVDFNADPHCEWIPDFHATRGDVTLTIKLPVKTEAEPHTVIVEVPLEEWLEMCRLMVGYFGDKKK
jgi:hypothetical protein